MMMKFKICDHIFQINNKIKHLNPRIEELASTFLPVKTNKSANSKLTIKEDSLIISSDTYNDEIKMNVFDRDIYQIFYMFIYSCLNDSKHAFMHSTLVSKHGRGHLILGTFGAGKTTLSLELEKQGFEINSADHTFIKIEGGNLFAQFGTKRMKFNEETRYLPGANIQKEIPIDKIYYLIGLCEKGVVKFEPINDNIRKSKKIWPSITWVYSNPLTSLSNVFATKISDDVVQYVNDFSNTNTEISICRGDPKSVAKYISNSTLQEYKIKFSAINDEIGKNLKEQLKNICAAKFENIELRKINNKNLDELSQYELNNIKTIISESNINVSCIDSPIGKLNNIYKKTQLDKYLKIAKLFNCKYIRIFSNLGKDLTSSNKILREIYDYAKRQDITLLVENETNHYFENGNSKMEIQSVLFDNGNCQKSKYNPLKMLKKYKEKILYIHLRDYDKKKYKYVTYGSGDYGIKKIIRYLCKIRFTGIISLESHLPMNNENCIKGDSFLKAVRNLNEMIFDEEV